MVRRSRSFSYIGDDMKQTNRETYARLTGDLPHSWSNPIEGTYISVMQWWHPEKPEKLLAQAVYQKIGGAQGVATVNVGYYICEEID
jgi:hypothetical protein